MAALDPSDLVGPDLTPPFDAVARVVASADGLGVFMTVEEATTIAAAAREGTVPMFVGPPPDPTELVD